MFSKIFVSSERNMYPKKTDLSNNICDFETVSTMLASNKLALVGYLENI